MSRVQSLRACSVSLAQNGQPADALRDGEGLRELQMTWRWLGLEGVDVASGGRSHAWIGGSMNQTGKESAAPHTPGSARLGTVGCSVSSQRR
jgi:hypothetical protein